MLTTCYMQSQVKDHRLPRGVWLLCIFAGLGVVANLQWRNYSLLFTPFYEEFFFI